MNLVRRMCVAAGLVTLSVPGLNVWAHSWQWAWDAGFGVIAGVVATLLVRDPS